MHPQGLAGPVDLDLRALDIENEGKGFPFARWKIIKNIGGHTSCTLYRVALIRLQNLP